MKLEDLDWWHRVRKKERFVIINDTLHKKCTICLEMKPMELFTADKQTTDRRTSDCNQCRSTKQDRVGAK